MLPPVSPALSLRLLRLALLARSRGSRIRAARGRRGRHAVATVTTAVTTVTAHVARRGRRGSRGSRSGMPSGRSSSAFIDSLTRPFSSVSSTLTLHDLAFLQVVGDLLDALVGDLADVQQAVLAGQQVTSAPKSRILVTGPS